MPTFVRVLIAVVAGLATWLAVGTLGNVALRAVLPGYTAAEPTLQFTLAMQLGRLAVGALSSLAAGAACAWLSRRSARAVAVLGLLLTALFVPIHARLWPWFPVWYHLVFLASLLPLAWAGARLLPAAAKAAP